MAWRNEDLVAIQEARILVDTAQDAQLLIKEYQQDDLDRVIWSVFQALPIQIPNWVEQEIAETASGNPIDKQTLLNDFLDQWQKELAEQKCIGVLSEDSAKQILQVGVPLGVVVVTLPMENVILNTLYSLIIGIKSGNATILIPHRRACKITKTVFTFMKECCEAAGFPKGGLVCLTNLAEEGLTEIFNHPQTSLILDIGCQEHVNQTVINKPTLYGGTGSTPVFIERTADIKQAAKAIVKSCSYDNGILPAAEQYLITEGVIAAKAKDELLQAGAYFMSKAEEEKLIQLLAPQENQINPQCIGKSAQWLAQKADFTVPEQTKVLVSEQPYIYGENPFANEMACPILTFYLEPDWLHACEKSIHLLKERRNGHTLAIHSKNQQVIREFALKKPVGRMIVNAPASLASLGFNSPLPMSVVLGGLTTGKGMSAGNITAVDLTYVRTISYPLKEIEEASSSAESHFSSLERQVLEKILKKLTEK